MLGLILETLGSTMRIIFSVCLRRGPFSREWQQAALVLLPKLGKAPGTGSIADYRPICVLDETCKFLESVMAGCFMKHQETTGPDLRENQFGFRRGGQ